MCSRVANQDLVNRYWDAFRSLVLCLKQFRLCQDCQKQAESDFVNLVNTFKPVRNTLWKERRSTTHQLHRSTGRKVYRLTPYYWHRSTLSHDQRATAEVIDPAINSLKIGKLMNYSYCLSFRISIICLISISL